MASSDDDLPVTETTDDDASADRSAMRAALGMRTRPMPLALASGEVIDDAYRIERRLGAGGMGVVYLARDLRLHRDVAIKLHAAAAGEPGGERLMREAAAMAQLTHGNVATVHEVGTWAGHPYVAMEYVAGGTARAWLAAGPRTPREILTLFVAAGRGLAAAHAIGLVHRDFKPDNVLVGDDGRVRVADFGLVRGFDQVDGDAAVPSDLPLTALTAAGSVVGTPAYMAPEQRRAGKVGPAADQFAFAVALWEALAGERPFAGATDAQLTAAIADGKLRAAPPPRRMPPHVARALTRALAADPDARFPSIDALLVELARDPAARRRRIAAVAGVVALVATLAVAVVIARRGGAAASPCQAGTEVDAAWDDARRDQVRRAFGAVGTAWARLAGERAVGALADRATAWTTTSMTACRASRVTRTWTDDLYARARHCLDRRLGELSATANVLATADTDVATRAVELVDALPDVAACADPAQLDRDVPPPSDPALAAKVALVERDLESAQAQSRAGRLDDVAATVPALATRADALGYAPLIAEVANLRGNLAANRGQDDATAQMVDAYYLARRAGLGTLAVHTALSLAQHTGALGEHDEAERWYRLAEADVVGLRLGAADVMLLAMAHAIVLDTTDRGEEARAEAERALALARELHVDDPTHLDVLDAMDVLSTIDAGLGRYGDAVTLGRELLAAAEARDGPEHPRLLNVLSNLGLSLSSAGEHDEAIAMQERAVALSRETLPPGSIHLGYGLLNLGVALIEAHRPEEAIAPLREAESVIVAATGAGSEDHALVEGQLGLALSRKGASAEAVEVLTSALAHARALAGGDDTLDVAYLLQNLGAAANDGGRPADAIPRYREALAIFTRLDAPAASAHADLATSLLGVKQPREALAEAEAALAAYADTGVDDDTIARVELVLARAAWDTGDHPRALASAEAAAGHVDSDASLRDEIAAWQAQHP